MAALYPQFYDLASGSLDVTLEIWMSNFGDILTKVLKDPPILCTGAHKPEL